MEVRAAVQDDAFILQISGDLHSNEATAIKAKVDEKISAGIAKCIFALDSFNHQDASNRDQVIQVADYCRNRLLGVALCGVPQATWELYRPKTVKAFPIFVTKEEALDFLKTPPAKPEDAATKGAENNEESLKKQRLDALISNYERYFQSNDNDPFRLDFFIQKYKEKPDSSGLRQEKKAQIAVEQLKIDLNALENECVSLAQKTKTLILARKSPSSGIELENKMKSLTHELSETDKANRGFAFDIKNKMALIEKHAKTKSELATGLEAEMKDLDAKLTTFEQETVKLKAKFEQEEQALQKQIDQKKSNP